METENRRKNGKCIVRKTGRKKEKELMKRRKERWKKRSIVYL